MYRRISRPDATKAWKTAVSVASVRQDLGRFEIVSDRTLSNDRRDTAAGSRDRQTHTTEAPFDEEETTNQVASEVGADGAGLSCPGSSVVADEDER